MRPKARAVAPPPVLVTCPAGLLEALEGMQRGEVVEEAPLPASRVRPGVWIGPRRVRDLASELAQLEVEELRSAAHSEELGDEEALMTLADLADSEPLGG